jgi:rSAM/selenodomain-associated transferase 1
MSEGVCAIAVMAKSSVAGTVKTRLVPPLTYKEAAEFNTCCLYDVATNLTAAAARVPIQAFVAYSPAGSEAFFASLLPDGFGLLPPKEPTIGRSLVYAAQDLFAAGYGSVCLVNADSPTLPTRVLAEAARRLRHPGDRVVLGPAADGGYYLIGLKQFHSRLFENIDWSTERVFRQTMARAGEIGLPVAVLPEWYDVDDDQALAILARELFGGSGAGTAYEGGYPAPRTAAFLRELAATNGALKRFFEHSLTEEAPQPGQCSGP